ncbi:hypothetical protein MMC07_004576 [Pseudocyphellaria aurata]|nr:hypothetical protein [Pseudocyphellaria aurata]
MSDFDLETGVLMPMHKEEQIRSPSTSPPPTPPQPLDAIPKLNKPAPLAECEGKYSSHIWSELAVATPKEEQMRSPSTSPPPTPPQPLDAISEPNKPAPLAECEGKYSSHIWSELAVATPKEEQMRSPSTPPPPPPPQPLDAIPDPNKPAPLDGHLDDEMENDELDELIREELKMKWILNLSMHSRDQSSREKFFLTYVETSQRWRRVTVSCDYRDAPEESLERDLQNLHFQRAKHALIYKSIRSSLADIQFYDTVTNLKLETRDNGLHVHVTEDINEVITYPPVRAVKHLPLECRCFTESELKFESHISSFVYKVTVEDHTWIKKEMPGPESVDEFLYEINALNELKDAQNVTYFKGVVVDDDHSVIKGLLIGSAEKGALEELLYKYEESLAWQCLAWQAREKCATQIVQSLSETHEAGLVEGNFTLPTAIVNQRDETKTIDIDRGGCPIGWKEPKISDPEPDPAILLRPETRPISPQQLIEEVKGIYAGLVVVEAKCVDIDEKQSLAAQERDSSRQTELSNEQWQALIALHKTLLHEHHDFFLASQHPSASPALRGLAAKYTMPARMWRHGTHAFLEVLRHRLPESLDHMLAFIYIAYSMVALLYDTVSTFEDTWIECLGDLGRYRMAIEDDDIRDREVWSGVARFWYSKAADKTPKVGRLYHHLAILARPYTLQQLSLYMRSLTCVTPFESARGSIMTLFTPILKGKESTYPRPSSFEFIFIKAHGLLFAGKSLKNFDTIVAHLTKEGVVDNYIGRITAKSKELRDAPRGLSLRSHACFPITAPTERVTDKLKASARDDRLYRAFRLPSELETLLVHDPQTDKASVWVNTNGLPEKPDTSEFQRPYRRGRSRRRNDAYWRAYNKSNDMDPFDDRECLFEGKDGRLTMPALANLDTGLKVPGGLIMSSRYAKEIGMFFNISTDFVDPHMQSISGHHTSVTGVLRNVRFRLKGTSITFARDF